MASQSWVIVILVPVIAAILQAIFAAEADKWARIASFVVVAVAAALNPMRAREFWSTLRAQHDQGEPGMFLACSLFVAAIYTLPLDLASGAMRHREFLAAMFASTGQLMVSAVLVLGDGQNHTHLLPVPADPGYIHYSWGAQSDLAVSAPVAAIAVGLGYGLVLWVLAAFVSLALAPDEVIVGGRIHRANSYMLLAAPALMFSLIRTSSVMDAAPLSIVAAIAVAVPLVGAVVGVIGGLVSGVARSLAGHLRAPARSAARRVGSS